MPAKASFKTVILQVGNNTGIEVPPSIVEKLGAGKKPPVVVGIKKFTYRSTIATMGGKFLIPVSAAIREQAGVKGGEALEVRLELDDQPREVALPSDFEKLLNKHPEAKKFFETLSYSNKQRHVLPIGQAKTDETRQRRIDKAISDLLAKKK